ncbi:MAG: type II toxin-antitoxin system VapC family toxin [Desulfobacterales bacterium]
MVIDTSVFIEFLRASDKTQTTLYKIPEDYQIFISSVTLYELLMGATSKAKKNDIGILTEDLPVLAFNEKVAHKAAEIYHQLKNNNKIIEFRDIFIGATCIVNDLPLKTLNRKHFERIEGIKIG